MISNSLDRRVTAELQKRWKICGAPADGCGAGPRKRFLTNQDSCPTCGSELRLAKNQKPVALDVFDRESDESRESGVRINEKER